MRRFPAIAMTSLPRLCKLQLAGQAAKSHVESMPGRGALELGEGIICIEGMPRLEVSDEPVA